MASKAVKAALGGGHTSGIYSDMTVDGPEIGDLVVIVDKAKNLPNRKTMGKQDPYCACRLGKEAKKTTTDRRGGQTPRWDQELRFTVHESPDYNQIKVTVFNDDKKTDLIGETWVNLDSVIVPGGGQSDLWHNLQFKGKYAGEIRIEMTYYDTRPKDDAVIEKRRDNARPSLPPSSKDTLAGPRQLKPKRRPLPTGRSDLAQPRSSSAQGELFLDSAPHTPSHISREPREHSVRHSLPQLPQDNTPYTYHSNPQTPTYDPSHHIRQPSRNSYGYPSEQTYERDDMHDGFEPSQVNQFDSGYPLEDEHEQQQPPEFEQYDDLPSGPPPPPPAHGSRHASPAIDFYHAAVPPPLIHQSASDPYQISSVHDRPDVPTALPSNLDHPMRSQSFDSANTHQVTEDYDFYENRSPSHRTSRRPAQANQYNRSTERHVVAALVPQRGSANDFDNSEKDYHQRHPSFEAQADMPPSLMPGYNPVAQNHGGSRHEQQRSQVPVTENCSPRPSASHAPALHNPSTPQGSVYVQHNSSPTKPSPLHDGQRAHQSSYPIIKPRAVSPDPRTPVRKSVSPQPQSQPRDERRLSGIPFSPDSYDALNPNAGSSPPVAAEYHTPDQARDAARQRRSIDPNEPIRTSDGRLVDPSDHIPVDNWAPEPERKSPTKRPSNVEPRARPSPTGAQPMPPSTRRSYRESGMRPISTPTPIYAHIAEAARTPPSGRNRLQKKTKTHDSSPINPPSSPFEARSIEVSPHSPVDYPLRERQNYYGTPQGHRSYGNSPAAPPVPAKIPMEGYGQDRLSEELRGIDIGSARRRPRY
ncbi:MAG: hypothetical protein M1814_001210 [Vezdaea aestivalis]|nr:MAG: hypothetical protein M1814_001210 [Vezdaea aestivalis]